MSLRIVTTRRVYHARSLSLLWLQIIWINPDWYATLPMYARRAVLAHECAHLTGHHTEWRVLTALFLPFLFRYVCHWQEYAADDVAVIGGQMHGMLHLLKKETPETLTHPKNMDRRAKILHSPPCKSCSPRKGPIAW